MLTPAQLLALQLLAQGFGAAQIANFMGHRDDRAVRQLLDLVTAALGQPDVAGAVAEARRRNLIV
jgi:hypothetical protein